MPDRPTYSVRSGTHPTGGKLTLPLLKQSVLSLYSELESEGHFQESMGYDCVDEGFVPGTLGSDIDGHLLRRTRKSGLWPITAQIAEYEEADVFDVIEFLNEHVSEPVPHEYDYHSWNNCGWHYSEFDREKGQVRFQREVNALLRDYGDGFRLNSDGTIAKMRVQDKKKKSKQRSGNLGDELAQNDVVGGWRLDRQLGSGGQGTVWKVRHTSEAHCPPAALKLSGSGAKAEERFRRECELLQENRHPHIVAVRDAGEHEGRPYMAMELATASLEKVADENASPGVKVLQHSPSLLISFYRQVCEAVAFLHEEGVVHRDIKPSNILLMSEKREPLRAVISDLGIAAHQKDQGNLTGVQEVVGTPIYRAPEVLTGEAASPASDVYGLGRLLEFLLARRHPSAMQPQPCPRGGLLSDHLCARFDGIIRKACAFHPGDRYANAGELLNDLPEVHVDERGRQYSSSSHLAVLDDDVALVLARIISSSDAPGVLVPLFGVRHGLELRLSSYRQTMALRQLEAAGMIETATGDDFNGEWPALVVTDAGYAWAHKEDGRLQALLEAAEDAPPPEDDDIPF